MQESISFPGGTVSYIFEPGPESLARFIDQEHDILITDSNIAASYQTLLNGVRTIVVPSGESNKNWNSLNHITEKLIAFEADKRTRLVGLGGGMITDLTGFAATIYMRGVSFGFVPTSLLGMVDASIGGKNGVNFGLYKNMLGTIRQPAFIFFNTPFLQTLPNHEWSNGFAEIIKYACIFDNALFEELSANDIGFYRNDPQALEALIKRCVDWKNKTVQEDEQEKHIRKLLNFGHTAGHAIEQQYRRSHGEAVALGMIIACILSEKLAGLPASFRPALIRLLRQYHLPVTLDLDTEEVMSLLKMDKKRTAASMDYIVLESPGKAVIRNTSFEDIKNAIDEFTYGSDH